VALLFLKQNFSAKGRALQDVEFYLLREGGWEVGRGRLLVLFGYGFPLHLMLGCPLFFSIGFLGVLSTCQLLAVSLVCIVFPSPASLLFYFCPPFPLRRPWYVGVVHMPLQSKVRLQIPGSIAANSGGAGGQRFSRAPAQNRFG